MQFSYKWLNEYFEEPLPEIKDLVEILTFHVFEIESVGKDLIDIDVLPNRSHDCLCYSGMAKEISTLTNLNLKSFDKYFEVKKDLKTSDYASLTVENSKLVPSATKRLVQNVKIEASPNWLKEKLESIGQKSINNLVDITNYVMWETGQPVHAFDFDKVAGKDNPKLSVGQKKEFIIRNAKMGEKITTLDGQNFELDETTLVIADKEKALDIAGTKGGIVSGIDENTENVVLSVCNFNQTSIRKTSRKLGLRTDASVRFENGISPSKVREAMERLSQLVFQVMGGEISEDLLEVYPKKANLYKVGVSTCEANRLLGVDFSNKEVENIFKRFGFEFEKVRPIDKILKLAPILEGASYKYGASVSYDAPNEFDCSSFTSYLFAQAGVSLPRISIDQYFWSEKIEEPDLKAGDLIFVNSQIGKDYKESIEFLKGQKLEKGIDHVLLYLGENKIIHASRENGNSGEVKTELLKEYKHYENIVGYGRIPSNSERYVVTIPHERLDLRIKEDLIEEIGRVYGYRNIKSIPVNKIFEPKINKDFYYINKIKNILAENGFDEVYTYTFGDQGEVRVQKPLASNLGLLRTNLRNGIQKSLELNSKNAPLLGLEEIKIFEIGKVFPDIEGEYNSLVIGIEVTKKTKKSVTVKDEVVQKIVEILESELGIKIKGEIKEGIIEINLSEIIEKLPEVSSYDDVLKIKDNGTKKYQKISTYPFVLRDIAVWVSNENSSDDILKLIKENASDLLIRTKLFDTYAPEGEDKISYAFNLVFQSQEKTLTDEEINVVMDKITTQIESNGWEVR